MKKITQKQYEKALEIIRLYNQQSKDFSEKSEDVNFYIILFDDYCYDIDVFGEENIHCTCSHQFYEAVQIVLTDEQYEKFIIKETNRNFKVSRSRFQKMKNYLSDNIWKK